MHGIVHGMKLVKARSVLVAFSLASSAACTVDVTLPVISATAVDALNVFSIGDGDDERGALKTLL